MLNYRGIVVNPWVCEIQSRVVYSHYYLQDRGVAHTAKIGFASVTGTTKSLFSL